MFRSQSLGFLVRAVLCPLLFVGLILTGCGSIVDQSGAQKRVKSELERTLRIKIKRVSCPEKLKIEKGKTFRCEVSTANGKQLTATIKIMNDDADLQIKAISSGI